MSHIPLTMETLATMDDGKLGLLMKKALLGVCRDCCDRPTDPTWRKVELKLEFRPVADGGDLKHVEFMSECKTKIPSYRTAPAIAKANMNGFIVPEDGELADIDD